MKKIIIVGSGETTRANVEALLDDYVYANEELSICIVVNDKPHDGQIWSAQYILDNDKDVSIYYSKGTNIGPLANFEVENVVTDSPLDEILPGSDVEAFFLWNDEDINCLNYLSQLSSKGISCKDLTKGLYEISASADIQESPEPEIPKQEQLTQVEVSESTAEIDVVTDDEEEYEDPLYEGIRLLAGIFAEEIAKELKKVLKK